MYFTFSEFINSETADRLNIDNSVKSSRVLGNIAMMWNFLEDVRNELGSPIIITSGYRCPELNKEVGGVPRSLHIQGRAVDIKTNVFDMEELSNILQCYYDDGVLSEFKKYSTYYHIAI